MEGRSSSYRRGVVQEIFVQQESVTCVAWPPTPVDLTSLSYDLNTKC